VPVNIITGENRQPEFLKKNPMGGLPVLELDDGTYLPESLAIIEYFEELHPNPPMIGTTPLERARVRAIERLCEFSILGRVAVIFQNTHPLFASRLKQSADAAESARTALASNFAVLDAKIGSNKFVAGDKPTIADCTLFAALQFAEFGQIAIGPAHKNIHRWYESFKQRSSASA
jgi:glutathione S-transferase